MLLLRNLELGRAVPPRERGGTQLRVLKLSTEATREHPSLPEGGALELKTVRRPTFSQYVTNRAS